MYQKEDFESVVCDKTPSPARDEFCPEPKGEKSLSAARDRSVLHEPSSRSRSDAAIFSAKLCTRGFLELSRKMPPVYTKLRRRPSSALVKIDTRGQRMFKRQMRRFGGILGHSYVKNIGRYVEFLMEKEGLMDKVRQGKRRRNECTAEVMKLQWLFAGIRIEWAYLFQDDRWKSSVRIMLAARPETLVVNIGSNDLCNIIRKYPNTELNDLREVEELARTILVAARDWRDNHGVEVITFMSVLRRISGYPATERRFTKLMGRFNDEMRRGIDLEVGFVFKPVEGFDCRPDGTALTVEEWSRDGAHPGGERWDFEHPAFRKYYNEVRGALSATIPMLCEK